MPSSLWPTAIDAWLRAAKGTREFSPSVRNLATGTELLHPSRSFRCLHSFLWMLTRCLIPDRLQTRARDRHDDCKNPLLSAHAITQDSNIYTPSPTSARHTPVPADTSIASCLELASRTCPSLYFSPMFWPGQEGRLTRNTAF